MRSLPVRRLIRVLVLGEIVGGIVGLLFVLPELNGNPHELMWALVGPLLPLIPGTVLIVCHSGIGKTAMSSTAAQILGHRESLSILIESLFWLVVATVSTVVVAGAVAVLFAWGYELCLPQPHEWDVLRRWRNMQEKMEEMAFFAAECLWVCTTFVALLTIRPVLAKRPWWQTAIRWAGVGGLVVAPLLGAAMGGLVLAFANLGTAGGFRLLLIFPALAGMAIPFGLILGFVVGAFVAKAR